MRIVAFFLLLITLFSVVSSVSSLQVNVDVDVSGPSSTPSTHRRHHRPSHESESEPSESAESFSSLASNPSYSPISPSLLTVTVRAFGPPGVFGHMPFDDDGRGFSPLTNTMVTSRIHASFGVSFSDSQKCLYQMPDSLGSSDASTLRVSSLQVHKTAVDQGTIKQRDCTLTSADINGKFAGSNPFFFGAAPDVKDKWSFRIARGDNTQITVVYSVSTRQFPATEMVVFDKRGHSVILACCSSEGSVETLGFRSVKQCSAGTVTLKMNGDAISGVIAGGRDYSISDFNTMCTSKKAIA